MEITLNGEKLTDIRYDVINSKTQDYHFTLSARYKGKLYTTRGNMFTSDRQRGLSRLIEIILLDIMGTELRETMENT
jgi:hypothetical protein